MLLLSCVVVCWALAVWQPGLFFVDDAWFYLQIGRNIALGHGSTFSGGGSTNGYHPLWQVIVAGIGWLSGGDRSTMLSATLVTQAVLVTVGIASLLRAARRFGLTFPPVLIAALCVGLFADRGWGSEGMLNLALHGLSLLAWHRAIRRPSIGTALAAGLVFGLLVLARLDLVFVAASLCLLSALSFSKKILLLPLLTGLALPLLPYLASNVIGFGHLVPVSGAIKSTFPHIALGSPLAKLGVMGAVAWLLSLAALILSTRRSTTGRPLLAALGLGAVLHGAYTVLFTAPGWSTDVVYYYVTAVICAGFCLGELARRYLRLLPSLRPQQGPQLIAGLTVVLALGATGRAVRGAISATTGTQALATWLAALPTDARIATVDAPGRLAWFSGRPVYALDGLTAPPGFDQALLSPDLNAWAARSGITHIVTQRARYDAPWALVQPVSGGLELTIKAPASGQVAGHLSLMDPPLIDLCALIPEEPCIEQVGVWAWPSD